MDKVLVSIQREKIDDRDIQGFVLGESEELVLINYVTDFKLDGLMVLRKTDISDIGTSKTDKFQTELLKNEGIYQQVDFSSDYDLSSWKAFIESAVKKHKYFILEEEEYEDAEFTIGTIEKIEDESISMKHFTDIARWLDDLEEIKYSDITCIQISSNYLNVYEGYFERIDS